MFVPLFILLTVAALSLQVYARTRPRASSDASTTASTTTTTTSTSSSTTSSQASLQTLWLSIYITVLGTTSYRARHRHHARSLTASLSLSLSLSAADWLMGPYMYALYGSYGYTKSDMATFYLTGFVSSTLLGTPVGSLSDKLYARTLRTLELLCSHNH